MTRVCIERDGTRCAVACEGHATGRPDVCAAVSCLIYSAAGWARNAETELETRLEPGNARLVFAGEGCGAVFEFLAVGFLQLERKYPKFLSVEIRVRT